MRNNIYKMIIVALTLMLASCYEDLGNYNYSDALNIEIEGFEDSYSALSKLDTLRISPELNNEDKQFDYFWGVYLTNVQGYAPKLDTIAFTKDLEYFVNLPQGEYRLVFAAQERQSGVAAFIQKPLNVATKLSKGWYLFKQINENVDYDVITPDGTIEDLLKISIGSALYGEAVDFTYLNTYKELNPVTGRYENTKVLITQTNKNMIVTNVSECRLLRDFDDMFYEVPKERDLGGIFDGSMALHLANGGKLYSIFTMGANKGMFGLPKIDESKISKHYLAQYFTFPILFDETKGAMCTADAIGTNLIYSSSSGSRTNNGKLVHMVSTKGESVTLIKEENYNTVLRGAFPSYASKITYTQDTLSSDKTIHSADFVVGNKDYRILYFAKGNKLYSSNIENNYFEQIEYDQFDTNEKITYMTHFKGIDFTNEKYDQILVATENNGNYKLYFFNMQAGKLMISDREPIIGKGSIKKIIYVNA